MPKRILVADRPESDRRISEILAGHELVFVRTMGEAQRALAGAKLDLIIVGVHFDESRMFDLLRYVRWQERHRATPVICVLTVDFTRQAIAAEGVEIAVKALGGTAFLDLKALADGEARSLIEDLLGV